jgi:hypothetical protein
MTGLLGHRDNINKLEGIRPVTEIDGVTNITIFLRQNQMFAIHFYFKI